MLAHAGVGDHATRRAVQLVVEGHDLTALGLVRHVAAQVPGTAQLTASGVVKRVPGRTVGRDHRAVRIACVGSQGGHVLAVAVVHNDPQILSVVEGNGRDGPLDPVARAVGSVVVRANQRARSVTVRTVVDAHGARVGCVVEVTDLRHRAAFVLRHGSCRELDAPVERTAVLQADGVLVGTIVVVQPVAHRSGRSVAPPHLDVVGVNQLGVDRCTRLAGGDARFESLALGAAHRIVDVALGQVVRAVVDHADADLLAFTLIGVGVGRIRHLGHPFAVDEDHSADDVASRDRRNRTNVVVAQLVDTDEVRVLLDVADEGDLVVEAGNGATA